MLISINRADDGRNKVEVVVGDTGQVRKLKPEIKIYASGHFQD
jgi:hypothetical protein